MARYYVNANAQPTGEHEVHKDGCSHLPDLENRIYLGSFDNCKDAVNKAKKAYPDWDIDGCYYCCNECHSK